MLEYCVQYRFDGGGWFEVHDTRADWRPYVEKALAECRAEDADNPKVEYRIAVRAPGQWRELED